MITLNTKIEDIVKNEVKMIEFFNKKRIDYCCNGFLTIDEVSKEKNIDPDDLINEIKNQLDFLHSNKHEQSNIDLDSFESLNVNLMIDSIIKQHHSKEREFLFIIDKLLNKILLVHFDNHGQELLKLHTLFGALKTELEEHFIKEEKITFPLIINNPNPDKDTLCQIESLERDHDKAGNLINSMIELTDYFTPPADACNTYKNTFETLNDLAKDVFVHIFKENSILFPKLRKLQKES